MTDPTLGEALASFREDNALRPDEAAASSWVCRIGPGRLRLPNFVWRRRAILAHDLHHVLTGYPCTMCGEFQMAAWEFAAGRMPHWAAALFCLPLVAVGVVWSPWRIWHAFRTGRQCRSLHGVAAVEELLGQPMTNIRTLVTAHRPVQSARRDAVRFAALFIGAAFVALAPAVALIAISLCLAT